MHVSRASSDWADAGQPPQSSGCPVSGPITGWRGPPGSVAGMEWTSDVAAGAWILERIDDPWRYTMHDVVPRGFPAYARIFHPAWRDRPVGEPWPGLPYGRYSAEWDAFQQRNPDIVDERVTWAVTAKAMGTTMHPRAQWSALVASGRIVENEDGPRDADGWRYGDPEQGGMPADTLASIADVLAGHTTTPDDGCASLWEGFGGLVGFLGQGPSRGFYGWIDGDDGIVQARHDEMLGRSVKDRFNSVFRRPTWQDGILSREVSEGARLHLPGRDQVLFRGGVAELTEPDWVLRVPWRDRVSEEHGFPPSAQSPSLLWPEDRAWVLVSEVDFDSTIVGGSADLVAALCADPRLEALEIAEGTVLTYDSDEVNR